MRLAKMTAGCGQKPEDKRKDVFQGDSWFSSVPTAMGIDGLGHHYKGIVKTAHAGFPKQWIEDKMRDMVAGSHLVLESVKNGKKLYAIGYKYCTTKVLTFIATPGSGTTLPGKEYEAHWSDRHGNLHARKIDRPHVVSSFFEHSNCVDNHNRIRQGQLALEKHWVTQDAYFRLMTSLFGIVVVDCWRAYRHHLHSKHFDKDIPARDFADLLCLELLTNKEGLKDNQDVSLPPLHVPANMDDAPTDAPALAYPLSIALGDDASSDRSRKSCQHGGGLSKLPNSACSSVTLDPAVQQHHKRKIPRGVEV